jgi:hypothetical protein
LWLRLNSSSNIARVAQGEYLQDICEAALLELGGQQLLDDAHTEAAAHVDEHHPWDEPAARVSTYCAVLWQRVEAAQAEQQAESAPVDRPER